MLDFRIETFLCVCRYMNYTKAAEELHITQPAVSQQIRFLENHYGVNLFSHIGRKIEITPAGEILRKSMIVRSDDEYVLEKRMHETETGRKTITFGVTMTIGEYAIVDPLALFINNHPEINLHVKYGNTSQLIDAIEKGQLSFALVEGYFKPDAYESVIYSTEDYIALSAASHSFNNKITSIEDLVSERLLVREKGSGTRNILERMLSVKNISVNDFTSHIELENMHTIVSLLEKDCGITFMYRAAAKSGLEDGHLKEIPLNDFKITHDFAFIWNKESVFASDCMAICDELRQYK